MSRHTCQARDRGYPSCSWGGPFHSPRFRCTIISNTSTRPWRRTYSVPELLSVRFIDNSKAAYLGDKDETFSGDTASVKDSFVRTRELRLLDRTCSVIERISQSRGSEQGQEGKNSEHFWQDLKGGYVNEIPSSRPDSYIVSQSLACINVCRPCILNPTF